MSVDSLLLSKNRIFAIGFSGRFSVFFSPIAPFSVCIQVDETTFTETRAGLSRELENGIMTSFSIDWKQTQYHELQKPLYSGIAAMLKILAYYRDNNIPQSPTEQADYWSTLYSTNSHATPGLYNDANAAVDTSEHGTKSLRVVSRISHVCCLSLSVYFVVNFSCEICGTIEH